MNDYILRLISKPIDFISGPLLDNPRIFNYVRFLLAGKQIKMKNFIKEAINAYNCRSVIDICSGTGDFAELISNDAIYLGIDLNNDFVKYAKKKYKGEENKKFKKIDVLKPEKIISKKFDAVFIISTIHHFSDKELNILLPTVKKIVNKVIIIADIIPDPPHPLQKFFASIDRGKFVRTESEKIKILKKYFKIIKIQEIPTLSAVQLGIICEKK